MNILDSILQKKRQRLAHGIVEVEPIPPRYTSQALLACFRSAKPRRSAPGSSEQAEGISESSRQYTVPVIAELKKMSPSGGLIRAQYNPVAIARQYQRAGAFGISVLTEQDFFQGSLEHLRAVRGAVDLPLLRKDFIVAPEQMKESRTHGADMALLIVACLDQEMLQVLVQVARSEDLLPLVEVHDEHEVDRAMDAGAELLGINNRNLKSFDVDLQTGMRVARYIRHTYGNGVIIVAESGIHSASDVQLLAGAGCQAFLIGESLLRAHLPGKKLSQLLSDVRDRLTGVTYRVSSARGRVSGIEYPTFGHAKFGGGQPSAGGGKAQKGTREGAAGTANRKSATSERATGARRAAPEIGYAKSYPDASGHFEIYGGKYVPETLMAPLEELEAAYRRYANDPEFQRELEHLLKEYVGRPTPLTFAARLSQDCEARIYFKREDLCHTGAHKINNALGQALLAKRMGKRRIVAETGAGQHGVAAATVCALLGLQCCVYMGVQDMARQELNVFRMGLLGAEVIPVRSGSQTLKDAINETMRDWVSHVEDTHYLLGSVLGPHPYPRMVRDFQRVIGLEARAQIVQKEGRLPDFLIACVGGGSNSMGLFYDFLSDCDVEMVGVEAGGRGSHLGKHAARFQGGGPGVLHGCYTYLLQDRDGQIATTHSVSAGLDYAAVGPEHALLHDMGRIRFTSVSDAESLEACRILSRKEGLIPALESAHAVAELLRNFEAYRDKVVIVNLSGRGDKDMPILQRELGK